MITNLPVNGDAAAKGETLGEQPLLIDHYLTRFDAALLAHEVADAHLRATWEALRGLDLLRVRSPLISALLAVPRVPGGAARPARRDAEPPATERLSFDEGLPGWVWLGETPFKEVCVGAVGVFWDGMIRWEDVSAADFADFDEPGYSKIAVSLSVQGYDGGRSLVNYECRVAITDEASRERFRRHWGVIRSSVGQLMRATVSTVARDAERHRKGAAAQHRIA